MTKQNLSNLITYFIATVWFINGLFCKVLNFVPRHQEIVGQILGSKYSRELTLFIGFSEILLALWIISGYRKRLNVISQMILIATMNVLEFILVPDFLLWGKLNSVFALSFILLIYFNEFHLRSKILKTI